MECDMDIVTALYFFFLAAVIFAAVTFLVKSIAPMWYDGPRWLQGFTIVALLAALMVGVANIYEGVTHLL